jgi:hypothetical protein
VVKEYDGESLKGHVEDGVGEGQVGACGSDNGLKEEHAERPGEHFTNELGKVNGLKVTLGDDGGGLFFEPEATGSTGKEDLVMRFRKEKKHDEGQGRVEEGDPECPAPADGW